MATAQFGVGGDGQAARPGGDLLPRPPVFHRFFQPSLDPRVRLQENLGGGGHARVPADGAGVGDGAGFGPGTDATLPVVLGGEPYCAQLLADVRRRPLGLSLVAIAHVP